MADQQAATSEIDEGQMTLIDHLTELRNRLGIALVAFIVIFLVSVAPWPGTTSNSIAYHVFVFLQAPLAQANNSLLRADFQKRYHLIKTFIMVMA